MMDGLVQLDHKPSATGNTKPDLRAYREFRRHLIGDEGFEGCGDIAPARVDGNDRIVLAAATFQETDHWLTPRECARDRSELGPELWQSQITRGVKM